MFAKIFRPAKSATQSGRANTEAWALEFEAASARRIDPLMGWTSSDDTTSGQVRLFFDTREEAVRYAESRSIPFRVAEEREEQPIAKAYADNFAYRRRMPWTH